MRALFGRANVFTIVGKYSDSLRDFRRIARDSKGHPERLKALRGMGNTHLSTGDTKRAKAIFASALREAKKERLSEEEGSILNGLAHVKIVETETKEAEKYAREALAVYRKFRGKRKGKIKGIAESLNNLGAIYSAEGKLARALTHYMKSLKERESIEDKMGKAIILNNIGVTLMDMRRYREALEFLKRSMILRKHMGFVRGTAHCAGNIGIVYWKQRKYKEAMKYFQENIKIQRTLGDRKGLSSSLSNIGVAHRTRGDYRKAIQCHEESLRIRRNIRDRFGMTINLNQLGWIYLMRGEYKKAASMNKKEKEICREIENLPRFMNYHSLHGNLLVARKKYAEGYHHIKKSVEISKRLHLGIDEARNLYDLGNILIEACEGGVTTIGTVEAAARFFEKGMHIAKKYDHQRTRMLFLKGFSLIDMRKKRFTQGKKHIEEAERIAMENNFAEEVPFTLYLKARILHMMKKEKEATKAIRKASREAEKLNLKPLMKKIDALRMQIEEA